MSKLGKVNIAEKPCSGFDKLSSGNTNHSSSLFAFLYASCAFGCVCSRIF